jgi:hypothetical protein
MQLDSDYEFEDVEDGLAQEWEADHEDEWEAGPGVEDTEGYDVPVSGEAEWEAESPFDDAEEMELAAELLSVGNSTELDHFLGKALRRGFRRRGLPVRGAVARNLFGALRPLVGRISKAAGCPCSRGSLRGVKGRLGSRLASGVGRALGLELESLSPEDQEFEVARGAVRLVGAAAAKAAEAPPSAPAAAVSKTAVASALRAHAPGVAGGSASIPSGDRRRGRWIRRGREIVVLGA